MTPTVRIRNVLTLFSANECAVSHRVRLVLAIKGVTFDLVLVDPNKLPDELVELNPYRTVPTLVDRDLVLYDVNVVCEYLDERYPHPSLMPIDPLSRARVRLGVRRIEADWLPLVMQIRDGNKAQAEIARKRLRDILLASLSVFKAAKFFLNSELSLADCALAPLIWRLPSMAVLLPREANLIHEYGERIFKHPAYQRSMTESERALRS